MEDRETVGVVGESLWFGTFPPGRVRTKDGSAKLRQVTRLT